MNFEKYNGARSFFVVKLKGLVIPYFWFSFLTYLYWVLIERRFSSNVVSPISAFANIFISQGADQYLPHNPALWFLTSLFIVTIGFYGIARNKKPLDIGILLVISSGIGYATTLYLPSSFPWSIDVAPTGIVFYGVGFILKKSKVTYRKSSYVRVLVLSCCLPATVIISRMNEGVMMADNLYGNYLYFYIAAFFGIITVVMMAMLCRKNLVLSYLGQNSLIILALHFPIKRVVTSVTSKFLNIPLEQVRESFWLSGIDTGLTILILLPFIYLMKNKFSFMLGGKSMKQRVVEEVRLL